MRNALVNCHGPSYHTAATLGAAIREPLGLTKRRIFVRHASIVAQSFTTKMLLQAARIPVASDEEMLGIL